MKFVSLNKTPQKVFKVKDFSGGADFCDPKSAENGKQLYESLNMRHIGGFLTTRPGIYAKSENLIINLNDTHYDDFCYEVTKSAVSVNGEEMRIAFVQYRYDDSMYYTNILFINKNGEFKSTGSIISSRTSDECFYKPKSLLFYSGKPFAGGGVFALLTKENIYDSNAKKDYLVYEISDDLSAWNRINDIYVPVVYINGRGNRYEEAKASNSAYTGKPTVLEPLSVLTDRFDAYFTSDGHSSSFRLPFAKLNNGSIRCTVYISPTQYTQWTLLQGDKKVTEKFYNVDITFNADRDKGIVYFTNADGNEYPLPMMGLYHENNILISAGTGDATCHSRAVSSSCCASYGSKVIFSGGDEGAILYSVSYDNPLYFPCKSSAMVGDDSSKVTALLSYKDGLLAFKENGVYSVKVKEGNAINSNSLLADNNSTFYNKDTFEIKKINGAVGCKNKYTCTVLEGKPIWLGTDNIVYTLDTSLCKAEEISKAATPLLENANDCHPFAVSCKNNYMLFLGNKAAIMEYNSKGEPCWYSWDFGSINVFGGAVLGGDTVLFCTDKDGYNVYTAKFYGSSDFEITCKENAAQVNQNKITSRITTSHFDFGNITAKKFINSVTMALSSAGATDIFINGRKIDRINLSGKEADCGCGTLNTVKILPHIYGTNEIYITVESDDGLTVGEIVIRYKESE